MFLFLVSVTFSKNNAIIGFNFSASEDFFEIQNNWEFAMALNVNSKCMDFMETPPWVPGSAKLKDLPKLSCNNPRTLFLGAPVSKLKHDE